MGRTGGEGVISRKERGSEKDTCKKKEVFYLRKPMHKLRR